jgi:hypothetical protein
MIMEALKYIVGLSKPTQITHEGLVYSDRSLHRITPPEVEMLKVHTLKGLTEAIHAGFEGLTASDVKSDVLLHVLSPTEVLLLARSSDEYARRLNYIVADCSPFIPKFPFGQFMQSEAFIIGLQSNFVPNIGDVDYVLQIASKLTMENVATSSDDGISQKTALRSGVVLKEDAVIKSRVKLAPYRTFSEVEQPKSEFLFRLKPVENQLPQCAIFEADGGKWRLDAMESVAAWLARNNDKITVIS